MSNITGLSSLRFSGSPKVTGFKSWHAGSNRQPYVPQPVQKTLVIVKPDALERGLLGVFMHRFFQRCLKLVDIRMMQLSVDQAKQLYSIHQGKPFFTSLLNYMTSGPLVALVLEGEEAIPTVRRMIGGTNTLMAEPGTIRGDFALGTSQNLIHASDGETSASKEIALCFPHLNHAAPST